MDDTGVQTALRQVRNGSFEVCSSSFPQFDRNSPVQKVNLNEDGYMVFPPFTVSGRQFSTFCRNKQVGISFAQGW